MPGPRRGRAALVIGLLIALIIVALLVWVIGTFPGPGWREPTHRVPTAPGPNPE